MSYTIVDLDSLESTSKAVSSYVSYMDEQMNNANKIVSDMSRAAWQGVDSQEFCEKWKQMSASTSVFQKYKNDLSYFADFLGYAKKRYETAQTHASAVLKRV